MTASGLTGPPVRNPRNPISRRQVDRVLSRSVGVFGIVFGAQTVPWLLGQLDEADPAWLWTTVVVLFGSLVAAAVLAFAQRWVRRSQGVFALAYLAALLT